MVTDAGLHRRAWLIVAMLFLFMLINFADKAVLGLAAVPIMREFGLTHAQFGSLGSVFFLLFSLSAVLVGFLTNRRSSKAVLAGLGLVWAMVQLPVMVAGSGLGLLYANRILLGAGEGPAFPVALHAIYKWFPDARRPVPTSLVGLGGAVGAGVAAPVITMVILHYSWRAAFGLLGIAGLIWVVVWLVVGKEGPISDNTSPGQGVQRVLPPIPYRRLFLRRTVIGGIILGFSAYWLLALSVVWLPSYLVQGAGFPVEAVGWIVAVPAVLQVISSPLLSAASQALHRAGRSSRVARGGVACIAVLIAGIATLLLPLTSGGWAPIACVTVAFGVASVVFVLTPVISAEITPQSQRGAMLGLGSALATSAGIVAPQITGLVVDLAATPVAGYRHAFLLAGGLAIAGALVGLVMIDPDRDRERLHRGDMAADRTGT